MSPARFHRITARIAPQHRDTFVGLCWEEETLGLQEFFLPHRLEVHAYFPVERESSEVVKQLTEKSQNLGVGIASIEAETLEFDPDQWLEEWKASYTGFPIGRSFYVHPPWEPPSPSHAINLEIEPGHAFGTGTHESTQLCLLALEGFPSPPRNLLDVGTGSGILAVAAARLFSRCMVTAIEIDPLAAQMAKENVTRNAVRRVRVVAAGVDAIQGGFDAVIANLTLPIFQGIAPDLVRCCRRDLVVSGFTEDQGAEIRRLFESLQLRLETELNLRGWLCFRFASP